MGMQQRLLVTMGTLLAWKPGSPERGSQRVGREKAVGSAVVLRKRGGGCIFPSC